MREILQENGKCCPFLSCKGLSRHLDLGIKIKKSQQEIWKRVDTFAKGTDKNFDKLFCHLKNSEVAD